MTRRLYILGSILALAAVYFISGKFGLSLALMNRSASPVWPPTGIALAVLVLWGNRLWPGVFLGAFLVNITTQGTIPVALGIAGGNTLEALLGAWLVTRFADGRRAFERTKSVFIAFFLAAVVSTTVSATIGATTLYLGGFAAPEQFQAVWLTWWLGDLVSNVILAPLLLIWLKHPLPHFTPKQIAEGIALLFSLAVIGQFVFLGRKAFWPGKYPMEFLAIPALLWAAFRFGRHGAVVSAFFMSGLALWGTVRGLGPFALADANESLVVLQAYMGTTSLTVLVLAAVVAERRRAEQRLLVQDSVSRVLAEAPTIHDASDRILQALCEQGGWDIGALWELEPASKELHCLELWHPAALEVPAFAAISRQIRFSPGVGLPGRVWSSGKPLWLSDVTKDVNFPRRHAAQKDGLHAAVSFPLKRGDDLLCVIECFSRQIRQPDEDFLRMTSDIGGQLGHFIDRKRAEAARQRSEALRDAILESAMDCIISIDRDGTIMEFNAAAEQTFGYSRAEALGKPLAQLIIPPRLREQHRRGLAHYLATGEGPVLGKRLEVPALRSDGTEIPVELSIKPIRLGGERIFTATLRDITERKQAEDALKASQQELQHINRELDQRIHARTIELQEALSDLETFSYSISHDLRAPLRSIKGYSSLLLESCPDKLTPEELEHLRHVASAADRMDNLIRDVLSYSQTARAEIKLTPVDMDRLTRELIQQDPALQPPHAMVAIEGQLPMVMAHQPSLTQCIVNLLGNAVKFIPAGTLPRVTVWAEPNATHAKINFQDNGIGIAVEDQAKIFKLFGRLHSASRYAGTGIGLTIVKKAIERAGGSVGLASQPGGGSKFWIELPLAKSAAKDA